jgi:hypothetical protein
VSGRVNEILTVGGVIEVRGYNLKIEGDDPACGLWFIPENGIETKAAVMIENKPARIIAMIPQIRHGQCQVKVVTQYTGGGTFLKMPKMFIYPKKLNAE